MRGKNRCCFNANAAVSATRETDVANAYALNVAPVLAEKRRIISLALLPATASITVFMTCRDMGWR